MISVRTAILGVAVLFGLPTAATAGEGTSITGTQFPTLPCSGEASPRYPDVGDTPAVKVWRDDGLKGWKTPECMGFPRMEPNSLMVTTGRFRADGGMAEIAGRLAQVSKLKTVRYYAGSDESWKNLYTEAYALADGAPGGGANGRRPDYTQDDVQNGRTLRYWQEENSMLSGIVYRIKIVERTDDRLVYTIVNESAAKAMLMTVTEPGEFRQHYVVERDSGTIWRYYSLVEARIGGPITPSARSFQSRAIAYYRHLAGYPTEVAFKTAP
jgi:hypothetical protein